MPTTDEYPPLSLAEENMLLLYAADLRRRTRWSLTCINRHGRLVVLSREYDPAYATYRVPRSWIQHLR